MSTRILVVDDEVAVTDLLVYNLRKAHYEVLAAADGRTALRQRAAFAGQHLAHGLERGQPFRLGPAR